ncbi:tetratricopeptide repeat protein [Acidimangrovimonas sediminis]|uniref:tetratricopeptide repeat protein n=1 Tax=Acidimangrovimonas sediminis TaxID=2056283 RepID=UPI000C806E5F|nr:tetratricopeptide repeat protein [Acidimangrovimonas sediminis]
MRALRLGLVSAFAAGLVALPLPLVAATQGEAAAKQVPAKAAQDDALTLLPAGTAGAYLAARQASHDSDYAAAARYTGQLLALDNTQPAIMETAIQSDVLLGNFGAAVPIARDMQKRHIRSQVALLVLLGDQLDKGQYDAVLAELDKGSGVGSLVDGLVSAWSDLGAGKMSEATAAFDKVIKAPAMQGFGLYHKALALASVGDFEGAEKILGGKGPEGMQLTRRGLIAEAQILSQLERGKQALQLLDANFPQGSDPGIDAMREKLKAGETLPFTVVRNARDGLAEVFFTVATALQGQASDSYTLMFSRIALHLRPHLTGAALLTAQLLNKEGQYDLALDVYGSVPKDDPSYFVAEMGRADTLYDQGRAAEATDILGRLSKVYPQVLEVQAGYADMLRQQERWGEAVKAYDKAVDLIGVKREAGDWVVFYMRGMSEERAGDWSRAEPDLREALKLNPDQPEVLNYLGYALVDRGEKLDEALDLIKKAVSERPNDGFIRDSLAWAYYRMGDVQKALPVMEKASEMEPVDPVVTDHLGDVYWAVGRKLEAQFQWRRALSYGPDDQLAARLREKLSKGLDAVLKEEGKMPEEPAKASNPVTTNGG